MCIQRLFGTEANLTYIVTTHSCTVASSVYSGRLVQRLYSDAVCKYVASPLLRTVVVSNELKRDVRNRSRKVSFNRHLKDELRLRRLIYWRQCFPYYCAKKGLEEVRVNYNGNR